jgi:hypothetical protein
MTIERQQHGEPYEELTLSLKESATKSHPLSESSGVLIGDAPARS